MRRMLTIVGASLLLAGAGIHAQPPSPAPLDPARLAAAKALVEAAMPPATRDNMIRAMLTPMMANMRQALAEAPQMTEIKARNPQAGVVLDRFLQRTTENTLADLQASMPKLTTAMAEAYARHLTLAQINETRAFYQTATGRALVASLPAITGDPAVLQVQREMVTAALARLPEQVKQLQAEMAAAGPTS